MAGEATDHAVLHVLRVRGAVTRAMAARVSDQEKGEPALQQLLDQGLLAERAGRLIVTPAGIDHDNRWLQAAVSSPAGLATLYDDTFLPLNLRFKRWATTWQERGEDIDQLETAVEIHEEVTTWLARAAARAPHLGHYRPRLASAMDAFLEGDVPAMFAAAGESYHNIWFELHEDLLTTLGRTRDEESE